MDAVRGMGAVRDGGDRERGGGYRDGWRDGGMEGEGGMDAMRDAGREGGRDAVRDAGREEGRDAVRDGGTNQS